MKKVLITLLISIFICLSCVACSSKGICEMCDQEETLTKYVCRDGDIKMVCEDCKKLMKLFAY